MEAMKGNGTEQAWSPEDTEWLKGVQPEALQLVAKRHGRTLFAITWQAGMISEGIGRLHHGATSVAKWGMKRQVTEMLSALQVLMQITDQLCKTALAGYGLKAEQLLECKADIERAMALAQGGKQLQQGERVSKGGIILDS